MYDLRYATFVLLSLRKSFLHLTSFLCTLSGDLLLCQQFIEFLLVLLVLLAMELAVAHLLAAVDDFLEVFRHILEVIEIIVMVTDIHHDAQYFPLSLQRAYGIDLIECVLLENDIVDDFGFPELLMVIYGYAVITKNVDLLLDFLTALEVGLHLVNLAEPLIVNEFGHISLELRILDILTVGVNRVYSRVTFMVGTSLLKRIEAARHFFRSFGHRLF